MGLSSAGVGSGLDVATIVSQLMTSERVPLDNLKARETALNAKISAFGSIKSAVSGLQTALAAMVKNGVNAQSATSSVTDNVSATADGTAIAGSYSLEVTQLAAAHKLISTGVASQTTPLGAGNLSIQVGGKSVPITPGDYSLKSLAATINGANAGVNATIINDGTLNHLVVTAKDTGAANTVTITADGGLSAFDTTSAVTPTTMTTQQAPQNAELTIDGVRVSKASNTITDAIAGVSLTLTKKTTDPVTVKIATDDAAVKSQIAAFVKAYNAVNTGIRNATATDPINKTKAALAADSGALSILSSMRREMTRPVTGQSAGAPTTLASLGITVQRDGSMAIDDSKLSKAISANSASVASLFSGADGVATRLSKVTDAVLADSGVINSRTTSYTSSISSLVKQEDAMNDRLTAKEADLRRQFTALDSLVSSMKTTSSFLTQQLG